MSKAEMHKKNQDSDLQEKLRKRRQAKEDRLAAKQAELEDEVENMDIE